AEYRRQPRKIRGPEGEARRERHRARGGEINGQHQKEKRGYLGEVPRGAYRGRVPVNRAEAEEHGHPNGELDVVREPSECEIDEGDVEPPEQKRQEELVRPYACYSDNGQK